MLTILDQFLDWLPEGYVGYRPVLADALHYYWQQLSETQQQSMLAHQSALPRSARLEVRLLTFLLESPILHKLGQVLARHEDLDPELRRFLQRLEVLSTNRSHQEITELVQKAMGSRHQTVLRSIGQPLAEASVAVVVPVVCETPTVPFRDGVLKLRKPGVQERFEQEIPIWEELGDILTESCRSRGLPAMDYRGVVDRVMTLLRGDLDFMQEYRHLRLATKVFAGDRSVRVPEVSDRFLPDALLMERLPGETLNACLSSDSTARITDFKGLSQTLVSSAMMRPFIFDGEVSLVHGDPHGGNILWDDTETVGIVDWSLAITLDRDDRAMLMRLLLSSLMHDAPGVARELEHMGRTAGHRSLIELISVVMHQNNVTWQQPSRWLMGFMDQLVQEGFLFDQRWLLLRKSFLTYQGLQADIDATFNADWYAGFLMATEFAKEWPQRCLGGPMWRSVRTHLSNLELASYSTRLPWLGVDSMYRN